MAIDSRDKRAGAIGLHWMPILPLANSIISTYDRKQCAGVYPGIPADTWVPVADRTTVWVEVSGVSSTWTPETEASSTWSEV